MSALVGLAMVTFLSWMANVKMSFYTVQVPVWNMSGLMLRSVGLGNILTSVLCFRPGWYVVYQLVRKVHPFRLQEFGVQLFLGFLVSSLCFVHAGGCGVGFFTSLGVQNLGLVGVPFFGHALWALIDLGITYLITGKKAWQFIIQLQFLGEGCVFIGAISLV